MGKEYTITPEMSGKIVDESHFDFHVKAKAKLIRAIDAAKNGVDLLKNLRELKFTTDDRWLKNTCNDPNVAALIRIRDRYVAAEKRPSRAKVVVPLINYGISLYASDLFWKERIEWFFYQLFQESKNMRLFPTFLDPNNWYPNTRRFMKDEKGNITHDWMAFENRPDAPDITEEYKRDYGLDPLKDDLDNLPQKDEIIRAGKDYMENTKELPLKIMDLPEQQQPQDPHQPFYTALESIKGFFTETEGILAASLGTLCPKDTCIVEIGSYCGKSTYAWSCGARAKGVTVYSVDINHGKDNCKEFPGTVERLHMDNVKVIPGDSKEVAKTWIDPVGIVFIDGNHDYEEVKADFDGWFPHVVDGGCVALHDTAGTWPGPTQVAMEEMYGRPDRFMFVSTIGSITYGVKRQVHGEPMQAVRGYIQVPTFVPVKNLT